MDVGLLKKILGPQWSGACTVIVDAEGSVQQVGGDSIAGAGVKTYAPRTVSGRIQADHICMLGDGSAVLALQQQRVRQATGEDVVKQTLTVVDPVHIVAIEFVDTNMLTALGLQPPALRSTGSQSGIHTRPKPP